MKSRNAMRFNIHVISVNLVFLILLFSTNECISQDIISLQISPQLNAKGDKWEPLLKSRQDNVTLVEFGPWGTKKVLKLDSGALKNKQVSDKENYYDSEEGITGYKTKKVESKKFFKINVTGTSDSSECIFSVFTSSSKRKQTVLGILLSKKELIGNTTVLSDSKQIAGNIRLMNDSVDCSFLLDYPAGGSSYPTGFLNIETDSCIIRILYAFVTKTTNDAANPEQVTKIIPRGVAIFNYNEEQIAVLAFKALKNYKAKEAENFSQNASLVISNEINKSAQMAIASLFAIIMGVDDKGQFFNF